MRSDSDAQSRLDSDREESEMRPINGLTLVVVAALLVGCAVPGGSPGASGTAAPQPESPEASESPTDEQMRALDWRQVDPTVSGGFELTAFEGVYGLDGAQGVIVTVMGPSAGAVEAFTADARFFFELAEPRSGHEPEVPEDDKLSLADLADKASESLLVEFRLTDAAAEAHPVGTLIGVIDPTVVAGRYHNFYVRDPLNDAVTVTLSVSAGPGVEARLYRVCGRVGTLAKTPPASPAGSISRSGSGKFDLVIFGAGTAPQSSTYELRGA
jgi:hypothetical protein